MKQNIRLTESTLNRIVKNSALKLVAESDKRIWEGIKRNIKIDNNDSFRICQESYDAVMSKKYESLHKTITENISSRNLYESKSYLIEKRDAVFKDMSKYVGITEEDLANMLSYGVHTLIRENSNDILKDMKSNFNYATLNEMGLHTSANRVMLNEFAPLIPLLARTLGKKLIGNVGKKVFGNVAKNAIGNAVANGIGQGQQQQQSNPISGLLGGQQSNNLGGVNNLLGKLDNNSIIALLTKLLPSLLGGAKK